MEAAASKKGRSDNIIGWNAPHIHFTAEAFAKATTPLADEDDYSDDDYSDYEKFLVSIGQGQQVRYNRRNTK